MTFRPYTGKVRLGDSDIFLDISDLTDGYVLSRHGLELVATLIGQDKLHLDTPQNPADAATKEYVDQHIASAAASRVDGDGYLQAQIDNIISNIDPAALDSLSEIVAAFQSADGSLASTLNNLADSANAAISAEAAERAAQDGYIVSDLNDEISRAIAAESVLRQSVSSEVTARTNADSAEQSARIAADLSLQTAISAEVSRATAAEQSLQSQISSMLSNTDPASLDSLSEIVAAFQAADSDLLSSLNALSTSANSALQAEISRATAAEALKLNLSGGTMSGQIAMGSNKITGLANGTLPADAVNLSQLQAAISDINPAGSPGQIQFNSDGYDLGASPDLSWDSSSSSLFVGGHVALEQQSSLPTGTVGIGKLVAKDDNSLYFIDSSGTGHYILPDGMSELSGTTVTLDADPSLPLYRTLAMTGTTTFSTQNLGAGRSVSVRLVAGSSTRAVVFPVGWKWLAGSTPASVPANKVAMLSIVAYGSGDSDVMAGWSYTDSTSISGSGTSGQLAFFNGNRSITGESNLQWDATNDRLVIGSVPAPSANLHIAGSIQVEGTSSFNGAVSLGDASGDLITVNGSATFNSAVSLGSNKITNLAYPSADSDAVNLAFLESRRLLSIQTLSASGNISSATDVVFVAGSGGAVVRLPLASSSNIGKTIVIKKRNSGDTDLIGTAQGSGQAIEGVSADGLTNLQSLYLINESVTLISDGNDWYII